MNTEIYETDTPIIFMAMFWGGGGPFTIPDIIGAYDWVNRVIPDREDMELALNTLLAAGLIERDHDKFLVTERQRHEFDRFRKRKRKNRFDTVRMYFKQLPQVAQVPRAVRLTEEQYKAHVKQYSKAFAEAMRSVKRRRN